MSILGGTNVCKIDENEMFQVFSWVHCLNENPNRAFKTVEYSTVARLWSKVLCHVRKICVLYSFYAGICSII